MPEVWMPDMDDADDSETMVEAHFTRPETWMPDMGDDEDVEATVAARQCSVDDGAPSATPAAALTTETWVPLGSEDEHADAVDSGVGVGMHLAVPEPALSQDEASKGEARRRHKKHRKQDGDAVSTVTSPAALLAIAQAGASAVWTPDLEEHSALQAITQPDASVAWAPDLEVLVDEAPPDSPAQAWVPEVELDEGDPGHGTRMSAQAASWTPVGLDLDEDSAV